MTPTEELTQNIERSLKKAKVNSKWADLAKNCKQFKRVHICPEADKKRTCWFCENFYPEFGDHGKWICHIPNKETKRSLKAATMYTGQQQLEASS